MNPVRTACELVLLFHSGSPWDRPKQLDWDTKMKALWSAARPGLPLPNFWNEATTRNLCDAVRAALAKAEVEEELSDPALAERLREKLKGRIS